MGDDATYLIYDGRIRGRSAVYWRHADGRWSAWQPNYGVWRAMSDIEAEKNRQTVKLDTRYIEVDEATAHAAARALPLDPSFPVFDEATVAKMYDAVAAGLPFEAAGVADTTPHRVKFSGLEDDRHFGRLDLVGVWPSDLLPPLNSTEIIYVRLTSVLQRQSFADVVARGIPDTPEEREKYAETTDWVRSLPKGAYVDLPFLDD